MLRITLIPFLLIILFLLFSIALWWGYKKVKKGIGYSIKKGAEIANDQQQKWSEKERRKIFPKILQKAFSDYDNIYAVTETLPDDWRLSLIPIVNTTKDILDEVALEFRSESVDKQTKSKQLNKKLNSIRSFFIHSVGALAQFVEKLSSDHQKMSEEEIYKARQNINVFKADLLSHQETLHKVRRFDFDVVMDVIKARLK